MTAPGPAEPAADRLRVGLQEWAVTCSALAAGATVVVVRKGGIHERHGGLFSLDHERFALIETRLHQDASRLRPDVAAAYADRLLPDPRPGRLHVAVWAEAVRIWRVTDRRRLDALDDELIWTPAELDARFAYRGEPFLHVVALRVHRLGRMQDLPDRPQYAGCRSWIPLADPVDTADSQAVLTDAQFAERLARLAEALAA
jgi:hypothetical protein